MADSARAADTHGAVMRALKKLDYVPRWCRWDPEAPPQFNWPLCFLFSLASTFTVSNLYYNHPILNIFAEEFGVSFETASQVPTLMQAGYAVGLLLICPLGDVMRRRPLIIILVFVTATIWLGLCLTKSFTAFRALSFLAALTTVTPQLMLPLVAELAPANRKAMMISIVFGGLFMGMLVARILAGVVTQFTSWRNIYFIAFGLQYLLGLFLFLFFPDYPSLNPDGSISYMAVLWSIIRIPMGQPLLVQTSLICFLASAVFVSYWTTLTFQLATRFGLETWAIGLFALIGMPPFVLNPHIAHYLLKHALPVWACIGALVLALAGVLVGTFVGTFSLAGPIIMGLCVDMGLILSQTACRTQLASVLPKARNRVNTVFMVVNFCGMLMGTAVGNRLYAMGGWHYSGYADVGFIACAIVLCLVRGPHETGWFGWGGGWRAVSSSTAAKESEEDTEAVAVAPPPVDSEEKRAGGVSSAPADVEKGARQADA